MILHCVFCELISDTEQAAFLSVMQELAEFSLGLEGVERFEFGPNRDFENKSRAYDAGFVIHFSNRGALEFYAKHPLHQALGKRLCDLCKGGADGIIVFDLETAP